MPVLPPALRDPAENPRAARGLVFGAWTLLSALSVAGALARSPDALRAAITVVAVDGQHVYVIQNDGEAPWQRAQLVLDGRWFLESPLVEAGTAWRLTGGDLVDLQAAPLALVDPFYDLGDSIAATAATAAIRTTHPTRRPPPADAPPRQAVLTVSGRTLTLDVPPPAPPASSADEP
jgi:hypothetical protein